MIMVSYQIFHPEMCQESNSPAGPNVHLAWSAGSHINAQFEQISIIFGRESF